MTSPEPIEVLEVVDVVDPLADYHAARVVMRAKLKLVEGGLSKDIVADRRAESTRALRLRAAAIRQKLRRLSLRWACDVEDCNGLPHDGMWHKHARANQRIPAGLWLIWAIISGRGFGKTRTGAESCKEWASQRPQHIAVIGETFTKVRDLCFEHPSSGLLAVIAEEDVESYTRSLGGTVMVLKNGTVFRALSAEKPDAPRGYAFDKAWYDEYGAWPPQLALSVHDNVMFALRESDDPRIIITTTPRPTEHVKLVVTDGLKDDSDVILTRGHMQDNAANLGAAILKKLKETYEGTRIGRQELAGELLDDVVGALWQLWMYEGAGFRVAHESVPPLAEILVSMDPAASDSEHSDASGLAVGGRGFEIDVPYGDRRPHAYVLHTEEFRGGPEARCQRAKALCDLFGTKKMVVEENKGGDWIPAVMKQVDPTIKVKLITATKNKHTRAEPVVSLYEQYRAHHVGEREEHAKLEDQQTTWIPGNDSPDVMDAAVWLLTELMVDTLPTLGESTVEDRRLAGRR